jgi:hypothetical protein
MTRRAAKVDTTQKGIVDALRDCGCRVLHLHRVGHGCPDLAVFFRNTWTFLEVKSKGGKLTPAQENWHSHFHGAAFIVTTPEEALNVVLGRSQVKQ